jgi:hypothetical protein
MLHLLAILNHYLGKCGGLLEIDLELLFTAVGTDTLFLDILLGEQVTGLIVFGSNYFLDLFRTQQHTTAGAAGDTKKFPDKPGVADMDDRLGKLNVPEMTGALTCFLVAGLAPETGVDNPKVQIHETLRVGEPVIIVGVRPDDLPDTHLADLFGR